MIKKFENFNNSISEGDFCYYGTELVYINTIRPYGDQYKVDYITSKGIKDFYISDTREEINNDFVISTKRFSLTGKAKAKNPIPKTKPKTKKSVVKDIPRFDVVQYNSRGKFATLNWNLPYKSALSRKKDYENDPKYRNIDIRIDKNK